MAAIQVDRTVEGETVQDRWCKVHGAPHRIVIRRYVVDDTGVRSLPETAACRVEVRRVGDDLRDPD